MVNFVYTVTDVQPAVESVNPSRGKIGTEFLLKISYFLYPDNRGFRQIQRFVFPGRQRRNSTSEQCGNDSHQHPVGKLESAVWKAQILSDAQNVPRTMQ
jgi:hypothetical protein